MLISDCPAKISWIPSSCWFLGWLSEATTLEVSEECASQISEPSSEMSNASEEPRKVVGWTGADILVLGLYQSGTAHAWRW